MLSSYFTRAAFSLFIIFSLSIGFNAPPAVATDWKTVPIADVHWHVYQDHSPETEFRKLSKVNVQWAGGVGDLQKRLSELLGKRYIAAYGQRQWTAVFITKGGNPALSNLSNFNLFFKEAENLFRTGTIQGIGEIHTNSLGRAKRDTPIDGPVLLKMYELVNRYKGFIQIHHSSARAPIDSVIAVVNRFPDATFVFSHCMFDRNAKAMRTLFSNTKNAFCELSATGPVKDARDTEIAWGPRWNGLNPDYKKLILDFPDRVMLGADTCCGLHTRYEDIINAMRKFVLADLEEPVRSKIAFENALAVFKLQ